MAVRITELSNELTSNIDTADAVGIVRLLRQSDAQLFAGWGAHPSINDVKILETIDCLANKAAMLLQGGHGAKSAIVFSGCGTSGRIVREICGSGDAWSRAWLCSHAFNSLLQQLGKDPCFGYLISGGDESLIISNELPEDDPPLAKACSGTAPVFNDAEKVENRGAEDLKRITAEAQQVMFFGITCGLSAPYVAGQIDYAMCQPNYTTVLVGFNPVTLARDTPIEKWHKTCRDTFLELEQLSQKSDRAVILNPIVGPEPITGSSRMKGGSMTAILLHTIFITALSKAFGTSCWNQLANPPVDGGVALTNCNHSVMTENLKSEGLVQEDALQGSSFEDTKVELFDGGAQQNEAAKFYHSLSRRYQEVASIVDTFAATYQSAYRPAEGIASLISLAADCLRHPDGHLYYIGASVFGILGLIDSSEMVDTYGAALDEVRGFVLGGWEACGNHEGDISDKGKLFRVSTSHFQEDLLPHLTSHDAVICLCSSEENGSQLQDIMKKVLSTPAKCGLLVLCAQSNSKVTQPKHLHSLLSRRYQTTVLVTLPHLNILGTESIFAGFALKLILNAISTGANVLKGRVYGNTMINLTVANDKLYYRSVDIISELSGAGEEAAGTALLRAIYRDDDAEKYTSQPISFHIRAAIQQNMVIPVAVVLASGRSRTVAEALGLIANVHSLRTIIKPRL